MKTIFRIPTLRNLIFANAAFGFTLIGVVFWLPTLFERRYDFSTQEAGLAFGGLALMSFIGTWFGGPFADWCVRRGFMYVARIGIAASIVLTITWTIGFSIPNAGLMIVMLAGGALGVGLAISLILSMTSKSPDPPLPLKSSLAFEDGRGLRWVRAGT